MWPRIPDLEHNLWPVPPLRGEALSPFFLEAHPDFETLEIYCQLESKPGKYVGEQSCKYFYGPNLLLFVLRITGAKVSAKTNPVFQTGKESGSCFSFFVSSSRMSDRLSVQCKPVFEELCEEEELKTRL